MRLLKLEIQAFRGVREYLEISFRSPLTIIYAPNGTGKTTLCDAVEWLLTGDVKRFHGREAEDGSDIRCALSRSDLETKIIGHILIGDEICVVERTKGQVRWKRGKGKMAKTSDAKVLEAFAPSEEELGTFGRHAPGSRRTWLRGNRFLSGDSLAALLDTDPNSIENRQQLFADILGVGHLLETEKLMRLYRQHLGPGMRQSLALAEAKAAEVSDRQERAKAASDADSATYLTIAKEALDKIRASLNLPIPKSEQRSIDSLRAAVLKLRATVEERAAALRTRVAARTSLENLWPEREILFNSERAETQRLGIIAVQLAQIDQQQGENQKASSEVEIEIGRSEQRSRNFVRVSTALRSSLDALQLTLAAHSSEKLSIASLEKRFESFVNDESGSLLTEVAALISGMPSRAANLTAIQRLKNEVSSLSEKVWPSELAATKAAELEALRVTFLERHRDYEGVAEPIQRLRALAGTVIKLLHDAKLCPVCSHDWEAHKDLVQAIEQTGAATSPDIFKLELEMQSVNEAYSSRLIEKDEQTNLAGRLSEVQKRLSAAEQIERAFQSRVRARGLEPESADLIEKLQSQVSGFEAGGVLRNFLAKLAEFEAIAQYKVKRGLSPVDVEAEIAVQSNAFKEASSAVLDASREKLRSLLDQRSALSNQRQLLSEEKGILEGSKQVWTAKLTQLRAAWKRIGGADVLGDRELERLTASLNAESAHLSEARDFLQQASGAIDGATYREEFTSAQKDLAALNNNYARLVELDKAALSIESSYRQARMTHVNRQLTGIVQVVSALFARMQANEVYEQVMGGDADEPLSWRAVCNGLPVTPENKFSQGQRQDFALAVFLARARGLGGSFLMDEPLAHLDDLNRVALLDVFRAASLERVPELSFILTTASKGVARHFVEKFSLIDGVSQGSGPSEDLLEVIELRGNPIAGVEAVVLN